MYLKILCTIKYRFPTALRVYIYVYIYFFSVTHKSGLREEAPPGRKRDRGKREGHGERRIERLGKVMELGEDGESKG